MAKSEDRWVGQIAPLYKDLLSATLMGFREGKDLVRPAGNALTTTMITETRS